MKRTNSIIIMIVAFFIGLHSIEATLVLDQAFTTFTTSVNSNQDIVLKYNQIEEATRYTIERSLDGKKFEQIGEEAGITFTDTKTTTNTKYFYRIKAWTENELITTSAIQNRTYKAKAPEITLTNTTFNSITISWGRVKGASGYEIYQASSATGRYALVKTITKGTTLSYAHKNLVFNRAYHYKVRSYQTIAGKKVYGPYSTVKNLTTKPAKPTITITSSNFNTLKISWKKISGANGYAVQRYNDATKKWETIVDTNALTFSDTKLTTGKEYKYRVRAYRTVSRKKVYGSYSPTTKGAPIPATPAVMPHSVTSEHLELSWKAISGASGYEITKKHSGVELWTKTVNSSTLGYIDYEVSLGEEYTYVVRAFRNVNGEKVYSNKRTITKISAPSPGNLFLFATGKRILFDYWTENDVEVVDGYEITRSTSVAGSQKSILDISYDDASANEFAFEDKSSLKAGTTYFYHIRTYRILNGERIYGDTITKSIKNVPMKPIYAGIQSSNNSVYFEFGRVFFDDIEGFEIYRSTSKTGKYTLVGTTTKSNYTVTGLGWNKRYYFKVRAYNTIDGKKVYSSYSGIKSFKINIAPDDKLPLKLYTQEGNMLNIKSVKFDKVKVVGNNVEYKVTVKGDFDFLKKDKIYFTMNFYAYDKNYGYSYSSYYTHIVSVAKGKSSKTMTFTIRLPKNVTVYNFD